MIERKAYSDLVRNGDSAHGPAEGITGETQGVGLGAAHRNAVILDRSLEIDTGGVSGSDAYGVAVSNRLLILESELCGTAPEHQSIAGIDVAVRRLCEREYTLLGYLAEKYPSFHAQGKPPPQGNGRGSEKLVGAARSGGIVNGIAGIAYDFGVIEDIRIPVARGRIRGYADQHRRIRVEERDGNGYAVDIEGIVGGGHVPLPEIPVGLAHRHVSHESEGIPRGDGCRVEVIDIAFVPGGYADTAHALVVRRALGEDVAYSENGIGGEAGIGSVLRMQGQPRESHREGHGQDLTESSFQHTRP